MKARQVCHYDGTMKTTVRLPEPLMEELRARSREDRRSINATIVDVLWRGLGSERPSQRIEDVLGDLVVKPALKKFDPQRFEQMREEFGDTGDGLVDAFEWVRGDR